MVFGAEAADFGRWFLGGREAGAWRQGGGTLWLDPPKPRTTCTNSDKVYCCSQAGTRPSLTGAAASLLSPSQLG